MHPLLDLEIEPRRPASLIQKTKQQIFLDSNSTMSLGYKMVPSSNSRWPFRMTTTEILLSSHPRVIHSQSSRLLITLGRLEQRVSSIWVYPEILARFARDPWKPLGPAMTSLTWCLRMCPVNQLRSKEGWHQPWSKSRRSDLSIIFH